MKHYTSEELDIKIHGFLDKKFEKYPELAESRQEAHVLSKPSLAMLMVKSLTSKTTLSSN